MCFLSPEAKTTYIKDRSAQAEQMTAGYSHDDTQPPRPMLVRLLVMVSKEDKYPSYPLIFLSLGFFFLYVWELRRNILNSHPLTPGWVRGRSLSGYCVHQCLLPEKHGTELWRHFGEHHLGSSLELCSKHTYWLFTYIRDTVHRDCGGATCSWLSTHSDLSHFLQILFLFPRKCVK